MAGPGAPSGRDRSGILGVAVVFAVNGVGFPSLLPRFPQIAAAVDASASDFGLALAGGGVGGLVGGAAVPLLARRLGLVRTTWLAGAVLVAAVVAVGTAPTVPLLALALALAGGADAAHDVAMNEVALGEQARRTGSVMGRLHGVWALGAAAATAVGAAAAALRVPVTAHLVAVAAVSLAAQLWASPRLRGRDRGEEAQDRAARTAATASTAPSTAAAVPTRGASPRGGRRGLLAALAAAAAAAVLAEGTGLDWSALALERGVGASAGVAGLGPFAFSAGVLGGRAMVDPLVDRLGPGRLLVLANLGAAAATCAGVALAAASGAAGPLLVALVVAGAGVSANFPLLFGAGDRVVERLGLPAGTGAAVTGTLPRLGGLVLPAAIGATAEAVGLVPALLAIAVGAVGTAVVLPHLHR